MAYCILPVAYCLLPIAYCLLLIAYCILPIAYAKPMPGWMHSAWPGCIRSCLDAFGGPAPGVAGPRGRGGWGPAEWPRGRGGEPQPLRGLPNASAAECIQAAECILAGIGNRQ